MTFAELSEQRRSDLENLEKNDGKQYSKKTIAPPRHIKPSATTAALAEGRMLVKWYMGNGLAVEEAKSLNKSEKDVRIPHHISHRHCQKEQAYDDEFIRNLFQKVSSCNYPRGLGGALAHGTKARCKSSFQLGVFASNMGDMINRYMYLAENTDVLIESNRNISLCSISGRLSQPTSGLHVRQTVLTRLEAWHAWKRQT